MVNFNGNLEEAEIPFFNQKNRGLRYGDALTESLRVINGKIIFWEDHYLKLMASMRILRMEIPMNFTMEFLEEEIIKTISQNNLLGSTVVVDIVIYRDALNKSLLPIDREVGFIIELQKSKTEKYTVNEKVYEVELFKDFYTNNDLLSTLNTNNRMLHVVGSIFADENNYDDCLLLNHKKMVVGTLVGNLFLIKDSTIKTVPLVDGCLNAVIRDKLIKICSTSEEFIFEEKSISPFELQRADELFVATLENGITSISKYRKKEYTNTKAKLFLERLNNMTLKEIEI